MGIFDNFREKKRSRAVVVGLDGVPFSLLNDLKTTGCIPNMASIFDSGSFNQMEVCIPEISSVSWSSFMTGTQSGEHGIYGFIDLEPATYQMYFPNFSHLKADTLWDILSKKRKKTVVINMPATYPARNLNGALISGFVATDINKAVYPTSLIPRLKEIGYRIDIDMTKAREDSEFLFRDLEATLEGRKRSTELLWPETDWDLFIVVITGTDRLMHFLWDAYEDEHHPYHQDFMDYFRKVDNFIGDIYEKFLNLERSNKDKNNFFMLSDHGFTKIETEVYLNRWMQENGYLNFNKENPASIMDIGANSTAFALDPSRIYINLKEKYPLGTVNQNDYEKIRQEIKEGLESITYNNDGPIIEKVYLGEELYKGPHVGSGPDLVALSKKGYDLKGRVNVDSIFGRTSLCGMHSQDDAFFYSSNGDPCDSIFKAKEIILKKLLV